MTDPRALDAALSGPAFAGAATRSALHTSERHVDRWAPEGAGAGRSHGLRSLAFADRVAGPWMSAAMQSRGAQMMASPLGERSAPHVSWLFPRPWFQDELDWMAAARQGAEARPQFLTTRGTYESTHSSPRDIAMPMLAADLVAPSMAAAWPAMPAVATREDALVASLDAGAAGMQRGLRAWSPSVSFAAATAAEVIAGAVSAASKSGLSLAAERSPIVAGLTMVTPAALATARRAEPAPSWEAPAMRSFAAVTAPATASAVASEPAVESASVGSSPSVASVASSASTAVAPAWSSGANGAEPTAQQSAGVQAAIAAIARVEQQRRQDAAPPAPPPAVPSSLAAEAPAAASEPAAVGPGAAVATPELSFAPSPAERSLATAAAASPRMSGALRTIDLLLHSASPAPVAPVAPVGVHGAMAAAPTVGATAVPAGPTLAPAAGPRVAMPAGLGGLVMSLGAAHTVSQPMARLLAAPDLAPVAPGAPTARPRVAPAWAAAEVERPLIGAPSVGAPSVGAAAAETAARPFAPVWAQPATALGSIAADRARAIDHVAWSDRWLARFAGASPVALAALDVAHGEPAAPPRVWTPNAPEAVYLRPPIASRTLAAAVTASTVVAPTEVRPAPVRPSLPGARPDRAFRIDDDESVSDDVFAAIAAASAAPAAPRPAAARLTSVAAAAAAAAAAEPPRATAADRVRGGARPTIADLISIAPPPASDAGLAAGLASSPMAPAMAGVLPMPVAPTFDPRSLFSEGVGAAYLGGLLARAAAPIGVLTGAPTVAALVSAGSLYGSSGGLVYASPLSGGPASVASGAVAGAPAMPVVSPATARVPGAALPAAFVPGATPGRGAELPGVLGAAPGAMAPPGVTAPVGGAPGPAAAAPSAAVPDVSMPGVAGAAVPGVPGATVPGVAGATVPGVPGPGAAAPMPGAIALPAAIAAVPGAMAAMATAFASPGGLAALAEANAWTRRDLAITPASLRLAELAPAQVITGGDVDVVLRRGGGRPWEPTAAGAPVAPAWPGERSVPSLEQPVLAPMMPAGRVEPARAARDRGDVRDAAARELPGVAAPTMPSPDALVPSAVLEALGEPAAVERAAVERTAIERAAIERAAVERASVEQVPATPVAGDLAAAERLATDAAAIEAVATERAATEAVATERAATERAATERAATERAVTERAVTERAVTEAVPTERAAIERAATERAATERTAVEPELFALRSALFAATGSTSAPLAYAGHPLLLSAPTWALPGTTAGAAETMDVARMPSTPSALAGRAPALSLPSVAGVWSSSAALAAAPVSGGGAAAGRAASSLSGIAGELASGAVSLHAPALQTATGRPGTLAERALAWSVAEERAVSDLTFDFVAPEMILAAKVYGLSPAAAAQATRLAVAGPGAMASLATSLDLTFLRTFQQAQAQQPHAMQAIAAAAPASLAGAGTPGVAAGAALPARAGSPAAPSTDLAAPAFASDEPALAPVATAPAAAATAATAAGPVEPALAATIGGEAGAWLEAPWAATMPGAPGATGRLPRGAFLWPAATVAALGLKALSPEGVAGMPVVALELLAAAAVADLGTWVTAFPSADQAAISNIIRGVGGPVVAPATGATRAAPGVGPDLGVAAPLPGAAADDLARAPLGAAPILEVLRARAADGRAAPAARGEAATRFADAGADEAAPAATLGADVRARFQAIYVALAQSTEGQSLSPSARAARAMALLARSDGGQLSARDRAVAAWSVLPQVYDGSLDVVAPRGAGAADGGRPGFDTDELIQIDGRPGLAGLAARAGESLGSFVAPSGRELATAAGGHEATPTNRAAERAQTPVYVDTSSAAAATPSRGMARPGRTFSQVGGGEPEIPAWFESAARRMLDQSSPGTGMSLAELVLVTATPSRAIAAATRGSSSTPVSSAPSGAAAHGVQEGEKPNIDKLAYEVYLEVLKLIDIARERGGDPFQ